MRDAEGGCEGARATTNRRVERISWPLRERSVGFRNRTATPTARRREGDTAWRRALHRNGDRAAAQRGSVTAATLSRMAAARREHWRDTAHSREWPRQLGVLARKDRTPGLLLVLVLLCARAGERAGGARLRCGSQGAQSSVARQTTSPAGGASCDASQGGQGAVLRPSEAARGGGASAASGGGRQRWRRCYFGRQRLCRGDRRAIACRAWRS